MKLLSMKKSETLDDVLDRAKKYCKENECDEIVIVVQKKAGGSAWFARDTARVESIIYLLQGALFHFNCMMFRIAIPPDKDGA